MDANQAYTILALNRLMGKLSPANVALLEQPLARGHEADLDGFVSPVPIADDESVIGLADVAGLVIANPVQFISMGVPLILVQ